MVYNIKDKSWIQTLDGVYTELTCVNSRQFQVILRANCRDKHKEIKTHAPWMQLNFENFIIIKALINGLLVGEGGHVSSLNFKDGRSAFWRVEQVLFSI